MDERDFARFQFKTDSDRLGFIDTGPWNPVDRYTQHTGIFKSQSYQRKDHEIDLMKTPC